MKHQLILSIATVFSIILGFSAYAVYNTDFLRKVDEDSPDDIQKLVEYRNRLVQNLTWEEKELEIAVLQKQVQDIKQRMSKLKASQDNATIKITDEEAQVKALIAKAGGIDKLSAEDKAIYNATTADIQKVKNACKKIEQRIADIQKEYYPIQMKIDQWVKKPPSSTKTKSDEHAWMLADSKELLRQARSIILKYQEKSGGVDLAALQNLSLEKLRMNANGTFNDQSVEKAFFDPEGANVILTRIFKDLKENGFSEDDREISKKMLVKTFAYLTERYSQAVKDEKLRTKIQQRTKQLSQDIFERNRSTIGDVTAMYDLFIASIEGWLKQ